MGNSEDGSSKTRSGGLPARALRCLSLQRFRLTLSLESVLRVVARSPDFAGSYPSSTSLHVVVILGLVRNIDPNSMRLKYCVLGFSSYIRAQEKILSSCGLGNFGSVLPLRFVPAISVEPSQLTIRYRPRVGNGRQPWPQQAQPPQAVANTRGRSSYSWVSREVLSTPSRVTLEYLSELLRADIVFWPGHASKYRLGMPHSSKRICYANHRANDKPDFLWVYDSMFTRLGVRLPLTEF
ncbi:hypothetical protein PIB30_069188 [Stylosanthes scabra]|uniref:Uncharacterized protein n=1 Tax=Stylosanthes scabra TaxID=79078 RepID=A0ABU6XM04_9FABA|nr:hypothetical protein [Stylosanthes scabra]